MQNFPLKIALNDSPEFTPDETRDLLTAMWYVSLLSMMGCVFNAITTFFLKLSTHGIGKMVLSISLVDFIFSISFIFSVIQVSESSCNIGAFLWGFGFIGSLWWSCCFAHCLFHSVKYETSDTPDKFIRKYWIISAIVGIIWASSSAYARWWKLDPRIGVCYQQMQKHYAKDGWTQTVLFAVPLLLAVGYCSGCYVMVIKKLRKTNSRKFIELIIYPLILVACAFPLIVQRLIYCACDDCEKIEHYWFTLAVYRCQGLFNAFAFGLSKRILEGFKAKCARSNMNSKKSSVYVSMDASHLRKKKNPPLPNYLKDSQASQDSAL